MSNIDEIDAKRYRWLRDKAPHIEGVGPCVWKCSADGLPQEWLDGEDVDQCIDETMAKQP